MKSLQKRSQFRFEKLNLVFFILFLSSVSFGFLSLYSFYTSPFITADNGYDAAFFRLVGQGMTKGYLPYRDFFDMKGPYFFLIEYIAQIISYGRLGIFFVQWINYSLTLFLCSQVYQLFGVKSFGMQSVLLLPIVYISCFTFEGGNLTEEFSLVFLMIGLLSGLRYFQSSSNQCKVSDGFLYGLLFGILLLIRITNAALICAVVFVIGIDLLFKKEFRNLFLNGVAFISGVAVVSLPMILYYGLNDSLEEMITAVFILGKRYSAEQSVVEHLRQILQNKYLNNNLLLLVPFLIGVWARHRIWQERLLLIAGSFFTFIAVSAGNGYTHYYTLTLPLIAMGIGETVALMREKRVPSIADLVAPALVVIMLFQQVNTFKSCTYNALALSKRAVSDQNEYKEIASYIPAEARDSVFCYNIHPNWYTYTDLFPCIKYCGWQNHYIALMPEIESDMEQLFQSDPPQYLVLPTTQGEIPVFLEQEINNNYIVVKQTPSFLLLEHQ